MIDEKLFYTKDHEWAKIDGDIATIGITDHAQEMLGEITFVELPAVGTEFEAQGELAVVESSKAASDVYSPIAGKVVEVNSDLEATPEAINNDCYGQGWICKIQVSDENSTEKLMDASQYENMLKEI